MILNMHQVKIIKKKEEFQSRNGISKIEFKQNSGTNNGVFIINGNPRAVDNLMLEITEWLKSCQTMHYRNIFMI